MSKLKGFVAACALVLTVSALLAGVCTGSARAGGVVFFIDAQHGWESTWSGDPSDYRTQKSTVWHTVNGGLDWKQLATRSGVAQNGGGMWGGFFAFATRSTGIWVRASHTVLRTTNAGKSWRSVGRVAPPFWLVDASFATSRIGWACSQFGSDATGGAIAKTTNAGGTWRIQKRIGGRLSPPLTGGFTQVSCPTALSCYVLGSGRKLGGLWATADGGKHWARRQLPDGVASIDFPTATSGWAVGSTGLMYATTNGGRTWHYVDAPTWEDLWDVSFCNSRVGYAVGTSGTVLRTADAGATWVALSDAGYDGAYGVEVQCVDATHAWIYDDYGNYPYVYVTSDGGNTWNWNSVYPPSNDGE